jgi:hypothetical protein
MGTFIWVRQAGGCALAATGLVQSEVAVGGQDAPPPEFTIAFFGDQGLGPNPVRVLQLVADEGADAVMHLGDFDYDDDPLAWNAQINQVLGRDFPYFAVIGNHDVDAFYGKYGYQRFMAARMKRLGIPWEGDLGVRSTHSFHGIHFVLTAPGLLGDGDDVYAPYIREELQESDAIWRISAWHVLMEKMQVGDKEDESGWGVYEESRRGGAIVATAHEHSYARTHPLSSCEAQSVAKLAADFQVRRDDPQTPQDEGVTFVFHSGMGGRSIRDQQRCMPHHPPYGCQGEWASIYSEDQGADFGALFGVFNHAGNPCEARFYFKDVDGVVADEFFVRSTLGFCAGCLHDLTGDAIIDGEDLTLVLAEWGDCPSSCRADVNEDGVVGIRDLIGLLSHWGWCR